MLAGATAPLVPSLPAPRASYASGFDGNENASRSYIRYKFSASQHMYLDLITYTPNCYFFSHKKYPLTAESSNNSLYFSKYLLLGI